MSRAVILLFAACLAAPPTLGAQGWIEPPDREAMPPRSPVVRVSSAVRITVDGQVARVEVDELFRNDSRGLAEGSYLYPLPGEAVFSDFSLFAGDQELKGETMRAEQARAIYEAIVRRRKDPALLTLAGHGLVRAQVFPIEPGQTRRVILRYTQVLERQGDAYRIRYPLGARDGGDIRVTLRSPAPGRFGRPYSPTHELEMGAGRGDLLASADLAPRGTLELLLPIRAGLLGLSAATHATGADERHFMLVLSPRAAGGGTQPLPRDLTLVVDVSGSMAGDKMEQARAALLQALGGLRPSDRFRLVAFASTVTPFRDGFVPATRANLAAARDFVAGLAARGGTNIEGALGAALGHRTPEGRMGIVLFMTDGLPSVGQQSPERLAAEAAARRAQTRVFPVGLGHDVNTYLLDRLAEEGKGRVEYVPPGSDVEAAMEAVLCRLDAPALLNPRIVRAPAELVDVTPATLPDLFFGEDLVILGRYRGTGSGEVVVEGWRGGVRERFVTRATFPARSADHAYLPPLWAARRVGDLTRQIRLEGASPVLTAQVRELGLRYGILTEYTSYLVLEPGMEPEALGLRQAAAPRPEEQTGRVAFERARDSRALGEAKSLAAAEDLAARRDLPDARTDRETRRAGQRLFTLRAGVWTDIAHRDSLPVVTVAPFSPAYFDLTRALPELVPALGLEGDILVAGRRTSIRFGPGGLTRWGPGALDRVVTAFRGA